MKIDQRHAVFGLLALVASSVTAQQQQQPTTLPQQRIVATPIQYPQGQPVHIKGLIISRDGEDMIVRDEDKNVDVVTLAADTRITSPSGLFKTSKRTRDVTNLLPGLIVEVDGVGGDRGNLLAHKIS